MKTEIENIGNKPIKTVQHYMFGQKKQKFQSICETILKTVYPDKNYSFCQTWSSAFDKQQTVVKCHGIELVCELSALHNDRIYYAWIKI